MLLLQLRILSVPTWATSALRLRTSDVSDESDCVSEALRFDPLFVLFGGWALGCSTAWMQWQRAKAASLSWRAKCGRIPLTPAHASMAHCLTWRMSHITKVSLAVTLAELSIGAWMGKTGSERRGSISAQLRSIQVCTSASTSTPADSEARGIETNIFQPSLHNKAPQICLNRQVCPKSDVINCNRQACCSEEKSDQPESSSCLRPFASMSVYNAALACIIAAQQPCLFPLANMRHALLRQVYRSRHVW